MIQLIRSAVLLAAISLVLGGCSGKSPAESADPAAPAAPEPAAELQAAAPAEAAAAAPAETQQAPPADAPAAPAAQPKVAAPAAAPPKTRVARDVIMLAGSPLGGVRFEHKLHAAHAGGDCSKCHHASRPEKAAAAPQQACSECHAKAATPPMKTGYQGAFHHPMAQSGICIDCHKAENAKGKKAPLTCMECHKKENR